MLRAYAETQTDAETASTWFAEGAPFAKNSTMVKAVHPPLLTEAGNARVRNEK